jgi:hypothetical protein
MYDLMAMKQHVFLRPFPWRVVGILTALYVVGNLLSIPRLMEQGDPVPSVPMMALFTALAVPLIAVGQFLAERTDLGAPLIGGRLTGIAALERSRDAILTAAFLFAWDHVDDNLSNLSQSRILEVLTFTGALGIGFGWCYWKFGLECAILAHILVDAVGVVLVNAVYFPTNAFVLPCIVVG